MHITSTNLICIVLRVQTEKCMFLFIYLAFKKMPLSLNNTILIENNDLCEKISK